MALAFFNEVAWLHLGDADLPAGRHRSNSPAALQERQGPAATDALRAGRHLPDGRRLRAQRQVQAGRRVWRPRRSTARPSRPCSVSRRAGGRGGENGAAAGRPLAGGPPRRAMPQGNRGADRRFPRAPVLEGHFRSRRQGPRGPTCCLPTASGTAPEVEIPESCKDRSFYLVFPANNLNTTIYVNGKFCGFDKKPAGPAAVQCHQGGQAGSERGLGGHQGRLVWLRRRSQGSPRLRRRWATPVAFLGRGFQSWSIRSGTSGNPASWALPSWLRRHGLRGRRVRQALGGPQGTWAGSTPRESRPASRRRGAGLRGAGRQDRRGRVDRAAADLHARCRQEERVLDFAPKWATPKLWWPDEPNCYRLRTTVMLGGKPADVRQTLFGFREWTWEGAT